MAQTPAAIGRRYAVFLAVAAVQVLLVAVAPSKAPVQVNAGSGTGGRSGVIAGGGDNGTDATDAGTAVDASGNPIDANGNIITGAAGVTGSSTLRSAASKGDLSHCDKHGYQIGPPHYGSMPPCVPVWHGGNNGGATMQGVDATHINFVFYKAKSDPQVNAILETQGLAASAEESCEAYSAWFTEINKYWELYGRKFVSLDGPGANKGSTQQSPCKFPYFEGQCSLTPPDPPCERAEAKVIAAMHPAFVLAGVADPALYDELTKEHVIVVGAGGAPLSYYSIGAPYYYGLLMDGSRQAEFDAEYWCRALNTRPAKNAGNDVKSSRGWGTGGAVPTRKIAVIYPETNGDEQVTISVNVFKSLITGKMCDTPGGVLPISYESDINKAEQQSITTVQQLINHHITTVACWCDLIAPAFLTQNMSKQGYFPEHFVMGVGLIDYDVLGRLYDPTEWVRAFGVSDLAVALPFDQSDAANWWRDAGNAGLPDQTENAVVPFFSIMAAAFQTAGPEPTPLKIAAGLQGLPVTTRWQDIHDPHVIQVGFKSPSPYTAAENVREVYWVANRPSEVDNKAGSYCPMRSGMRYDIGEIPSGEPPVFDSASNVGC